MKFLDKSKGSNSKLRMILMMIGGALVIALLVGLIGIQRWYTLSLQPLNPGGTAKIFVVEPGMSATGIASSLEEAELIKSSTAFSWYVDREEVRDQLQAGTYRFSPQLSVQEIVEKLVSGEVATNIVTILPGKRLDEVIDQLVAADFTRNQAKQAVAQNYDHPILADKPANASLEGYIFPETYHITPGTTATSFIKRTFDTFYTQLDAKTRAGIKKQGLSLHEAVILASIVQQESDDPDIQPEIAQVFLRRLRDGMVLGSDVTYMYAADLSGQVASPSLDSPYNTRLYAGLPPGPIGNFNLSAIKAVGSPAKTNYLYFVAGDDGTVYFSKTLEEHERLTRLHCTTLCQ